MAVETKLRANLGRIYGQRIDTLLSAMLSSMASVMDEAHGDSDRALAQLKLQTAAAPFLDIWGDLFKIPRRLDTETDAAYAIRIIQETIQQRPQKRALESITKNSLGITIVIQDLLPFVLLSDQWTTPPGRPLQVCDEHLAPGFILGDVNDQAVRCDIVYPYVPGAFGVWMQISTTDPFSYTVENVKALLPLVLISDAHLDPSVDETLHVSDGQLVSSSIARTSFGLASGGIPSSVQDVLDLINRHRASGTEPVFMGFIMN